MTLPNHPSRRLLLAGGLLALLAPLVRADDKKADEVKAPSGTWDKKEGMGRIEFADKGVVKIHPHGDKADIAFVCSYTADKDGVLKVKITEHEGSADLKAKLKERLPIGTAFRFKWVVKDDTATVEDVEGKELEGLKSHFEGGYEKKR